ncbi:arylsulfatase B [Elysia marginata]|uniref:Arylsulfatase B n=1 Tax=Elysia marginata TaxID=1093978 RepID=A0AAV4FL72_9GAST|nr:arylsulfatase B [Elysia marginata]
MEVFPGNLSLLTLLLLTPGIACRAGSVADAAPGNGTRPNIVFVLADDLGFHDVGYHGSRIRTPVLDQLSADGVRLENYYVQPICSPTRSQLMSGRYQIHDGIQHSVFWDDQATGLPLGSPTLADKLRESGYSTHMVGKWHLGFHTEEYMPNSRGFDSSFGFLGGHEGQYYHTRAYKKKKYLDLRADGVPVRDQEGRHSTDMYTDQGVRRILDHDVTKPLFLYMAYSVPHSPHQVPAVYEEQYSDIADKNRRTVAGMITHLDEAVGNLTQALKDKGIWDNTILVFSTDNGGPIGDACINYPLRGGKWTLWEGGVRGVAFVTGGKNIVLDRGAVNRELMHVTDWFPTLVGVAGGDFNGTKPLDGVDQWDSLSTGASTTRKWVLHNIDSKNKKKGKKLFPDTFDTRIRAAIRVGKYKLITGNPGWGKWVPPPETNSSIVEIKESKKNLWLFNIDKDPEERRDLSAKKPKVVKRILKLLQKVNSKALPPFFPPHNPLANPKLHGGVWGPWQ